MLQFIWLLVQRIANVREEIPTIDTVPFIAHVPAVILVVALPAPMNACAIATLKLIRTAGGTCWWEATGQSLNEYNRLKQVAAKKTNSAKKKFATVLTTISFI